MLSKRKAALVALVFFHQFSAAEEQIAPLFEYPLPPNPAFIAFNSQDQVDNEIYSESHALLIAEENYNSGWQNLTGLQVEMKNLADVLKQDQFHVVAYSNLNGNDLHAVIDKFVRSYGNVKKSRILIVISGHGYAIEDVLDEDALDESPNKRPLGYLVPIDAPKPGVDESGFEQKSLRLSQFVEWASSMKSKHSLMIFDACMAGSIFENMRGDVPISKIPENKWVVFDRTKNKRAREFLTAGTSLQNVPERSQFMQLLTEAYLGKRQPERADYNDDGFLSAQELGNFLSSFVLKSNPTLRQIPDSDLNQGEFIFRVIGDNGQKKSPSTSLTSTKQPQSPTNIEQFFRPDTLCKFPCNTFSDSSELEMSIEIPSSSGPKSALRNVVLSCVAGKCDQSVITRPISIDTDETRANVRFKVWGEDTIWSLRADVASPSDPKNEIVPVFSKVSALLTDAAEHNNTQAELIEQLDSLESESAKTRRQARKNLSTLVEKIAPDDIAEIVRSLPNSSYRKSIGVAEALGDSPVKWKSSEPEVTKSILVKVAEKSKDKTLIKSVHLALANTLQKEITAECTADSSRNNDCDSSASTIDAPEGYYFLIASLQGGEVSGNIAENSCLIKWDNWNDMSDNLQPKFPRTMTLTARIDNIKENVAGKAWVSCKYIVELSKL